MLILLLMKKTIDVAKDRALDQTKTVLPAEVARGVYMRNAPSLKALKLMHLMIAKAGARMADDLRHEIRLSEIRRIDGMTHHDKESLKPLFAELRGAVLTYDEPNAKRYVIGGILDHAEVDYRHEVSGEVLMTWYFGRMFRDMAEESQRWALLDRQTVFHLGSKYSVLLFQHIASLTGFEKINSKSFTIAELRAILGVPEGKMGRFSNLNQRVIQPSIEEINEISRLTLTATPHKVGRTVISVDIGWVVKDTHVVPSPAITALGDQGSRSPSEIAFPSQGTLKFGTHTAYWRDLAERHVQKIQGGHLPDLSVLTDQFRAWCARRGIPLDSLSIEKTFIGFCEKYRPPNAAA